MNQEEISGALEAALFAVGEPLDVNRICSAFRITQIELAMAVDSLQGKYGESSGIKVLYFGNSVQMCTNEKYKAQLEDLLNPVQKKPLSQASLEVLSIIAYKQPITRAEIEEIRGVKCDYSVMWLLQKGLIQEMGRKEALGRPMLFGTTDLFLRHFGLSSLNELPRNMEELTALEPEREEEET